MSNAFGDSATPVYRFEYDDGTVRRTDEDIDADGQRYTSAIESLAILGHEDPECSVELIGFE